MPKTLGLFYTGDEEPEYSEVVEFDLATVVPCVAGPARPQDRIKLTGLQDNFTTILAGNYERDTDIANISKYHDESGSQTTRPEACAPRRKSL